MALIPFVLFVSFEVMVSCTNDAYETGDSKYSYLRTDFVEAMTNKDGQMTWVVRDDGTMMNLSPTISVSWASVPDTTYRALLYYNIDKDYDETGIHNTQAVPQVTVEPVSVGRVYVLEPEPRSDTLAVKTDPVHFQSSWISHNNSYANISVALMTGVADSVDARQSIGMVCDTITENPSGSHTYYYRFAHDQGNVPEYYKSTIYISIPIKKMTVGDIIRLSLNTYSGIINREFLIE